ncbi:hypothetical protein Q9S36_10510 [Microbacterium sp. ARD31]|nr:hypothetical protein [Microbacterium sp. ARD31]MDT0180630.1 hypothetical protein [Microbacterium sp. ARD31]
MSNDEPGWTIRIPGSEGQRFTERQQALLDRLGASWQTPEGSRSMRPSWR